MGDAAEGVRGGTRAESSPATLGSRASRPAHRDGVLRDRHLGVARGEPQLHPLVGQRREDLGLEQARVLLDEHLLSARLRRRAEQAEVRRLGEPQPEPEPQSQP